MSFYVTLEGELTAKNEDILNKGLEAAKKGRWIDKDNYLLNELGERVSDDPCVQENIINIPYGHHRNIFHLISKLEEMGFMYSGVGYSTDGVFEGYAYNSVTDLFTWAKENFPEPKPDFKTHPDEYLDWQDEVGEAFVESVS